MHAKWAVLGAVGVAALLAIVFVAAGRGAYGGARVEQPIHFPHDVHAGEPNRIPCMYCHYSADRSTSAGIPAVRTCIGCHAPLGAPLVAADHSEVQSLLGYWERQEPIPWARRHDLPDHVRFPHHMHINAGIDCQECHGPVEQMDQVVQVASLQMGWCVDCHRRAEPPARTDCFICHY